MLWWIVPAISNYRCKEQHFLPDSIKCQPKTIRKKQVELREEVEQLLAQHNLGSMSPEKGEDDNDASIIDRLIEIKSLLSKQEYAYREQKRSRELRNRAISEYIVLGFTWLAGAVTMFIWLRV
jgi:hypothetical protein